MINPINFKLGTLVNINVKITLLLSRSVIQGQGLLQAIADLIATAKADIH